MKYLFYEKLEETRAVVALIYSQKPPKELIDNGNYIIVNSIPYPENILGKTASLYCSPLNSDIWYEYVDTPKDSATLESEIEELKQENQLLKAQNNALSERADFIEDVVAEMAAQVYQ